MEEEAFEPRYVNNLYLSEWMQHITTVYGALACSLVSNANHSVC